MIFILLCMMRSAALCVIITIFLLILHIVAAQETQDDTAAWLFTKQEAEYEVRVGTSFVPSNVDELQARLSLFARDNDRATVIDQETSPAAIEKDGELVFTWNANQLRGEQKLSVQSRVHTVNTFPQITGKI